MNQSRFLLIVSCILLTFPACNKDEEPKKTDNILCLPASLSGNVIAFYPFSSGSLNDVSGNSIHLSNNTTAKAAPDRSGNPACAFEFDNYPDDVDSLVATNTQMLNTLPAFSVSLWYQPLDTLVHVSQPKREYMVRHYKWDIMLYDGRMATFNGLWDIHITGGGQPQHKLRTGTWHHLVVTINSAKKVLKLYRDNVLQKAHSGAFWPNNVPNITPLIIGSSFTGRMDDIAIFNKELDSTEISSLYNTEPCCTVL